MGGYLRNPSMKSKKTKEFRKGINVSDINTDVKIVATVEDRASAQLRNIKNQVDGLAKSLRQFAAIKVPDVAASIARNTQEAVKAARGLTAAHGQQHREQAANAQALKRQHIRFDNEAMKAFREKINLSARLGRQMASESAAVERQRRAVEAASGRDMREKVAFITRMGRQQAAAIRETERERQRATRRRGAGCRLRAPQPDRRPPLPLRPAPAPGPARASGAGPNAP